MNFAVVGAGLLGRAMATSIEVEPIPRRRFSEDGIPKHAAVLVASGRSVIPSGEGSERARDQEVAHLRQVLDACEEKEAARVVVLSSSDVAGLAPRITGATPANPRTVYAMAKAAVEDECVERRRRGLDVTAVRLAPVHGPGKARTASLVRVARLPAVPLANGGRHSVGFIHIDDALRAARWLMEHAAPDVVAVGAGPTPLRELLASLAAAQSRPFHPLWVPMPATVVSTLARRSWSDRSEWALRLALPRIVEMDVPIAPMSLAAAARSLVQS